MRVVAGTLRGRRLRAPEGSGTRPTSDRVREATFNALSSLDVIRDASVLDLFAGSGALGIEALSRGAAHATFVEQSRPALHVLRANLRDLGVEGRSTVVPMDALRFVAGERTRFDLALADPPYSFTSWPELLPGVPARFLVAEASAELDLVDAGDVWEAVRSKRYGRTVVTILARRPVIGDAPPERVA